MDTLRTNPLTHLMIMNDDGGNKPLVTFLLENKHKYPNVTVANNRAEFKLAIDNFKLNFTKLNLEKNPSEEKGEQQKPVTTSSSAFFSPLLEISKTLLKKIKENKLTNKKKKCSVSFLIQENHLI
jgi:hypothetical protein